MNNLLKGRVILVHYSKYIVEVNKEKYSLEVSGRFKFTAFHKSDYPVVGDYVYFRETNKLEGIIERVEDRISVVRRLAVSRTHNAQIVASNIDILFICMALDKDFNIKKLQNFITMTYSNEYETVILLTKSDLCHNVERYTNQVRVLTDYEYIVASAHSEADITVLEERIGISTCTFIGSSGVGKSTLVNKLLGYNYMETNDIRVSDSQGRHTTVHRELIHLNSGGCVIDTPGIRTPTAYHLDDMDTHFDDIYELSKDCRFRNCTHINEDGCNVLDAIEEGILPNHRYEQYLQLMRLNRFTEKREKEKQRIHEKRMKRRR